MAHSVFVGLSTIDLIHTVEAFPSANAKAVAQSQELFVGGPATNAAIAFSHLGASALLVTAVGRSRFATIVKDELERHAVELVDLDPEFDGMPAISSVWVNRQGERSVVSVNAALSAHPSVQIDSATLEGTRILLVDGHFMEACQTWARAARTAGIPVVLDGGSWKKGTENLLENVDTAICSADFVPPDCAGEEDVIAYLQARGVENVAITHGAAPIGFVLGSSAGVIPVPRVDVVDTTGAGDILHGAFCYYAVAGHDFVESLREAAIVAADSCRYQGTRRWMQTR